MLVHEYIFHIIKINPCSIEAPEPYTVTKCVYITVYHIEVF